VNIAVISIPPRVRDQVERSQLAARREQEQSGTEAVGDVEIAQRFHHRMHAALVSGDRQHAKGSPSELPLVLFGGVSGEISPHLFFEASYFPAQN